MLSLVGAVICFCWASDLYGWPSGVLAVLLWSSCPNILTWASQISPDAGAASLGILAAYWFWRWLKQPTWTMVLIAGITLGLAELTKTTWIVLFAIWPFLWLVRKLGREVRGWQRHNWRGQLRQLATILILGLYILNLGYAFEGSFQRLDRITFASRLFAGDNSVVDGGKGGNRVAGTPLGAVRIPFPENYVTGIDLQLLEFDQKKWSFLRGEHRLGGWWYYYLYALGIKVPLGTCVLLILAIVVSVASSHYSAGWRDELVLVLPAAVVLTLVSSQTGFSRYLRYVLPMFPFVFVWTSKIARSLDLKHNTVAVLVSASTVWSIGSSLSLYPHSLSYFNELVGGPINGHAHLIDANIDWGQDLFVLRNWLNKHPEARPLHLAYYGGVDPRAAGIEYASPPQQQVGPRPGWHAVSVNNLRSHSGEYAYFLHFRPIAMAGFSIYIYQLNLEDVNRVRTDLGLDRLEPEAVPDPLRGDDSGGLSCPALRDQVTPSPYRGTSPTD
jgi:hypothetical protein